MALGRLRPGKIDAALQVAIAAYQRIGDFSAAAEQLGRAIERSPQRAEAWLERARCYRQLRRWSDAERDLAQARSLGPVPAWLAQELVAEQAAIARERAR